VCRLTNNTLSGQLPGSWSGMAALEDLLLGMNALTGTVPPSWGTLDRLRLADLYANPKLTGCLPAAWRGKVNVATVGANASVPLVVLAPGPYMGRDPLTAGTNITGYC
jgi:hypothetical protein